MLTEVKNQLRVTIKTIKYYHADVQKTRSGIYKVESATLF